VEKFGELLWETMDDTLRRVLGEHVAELIYGLMGRSVSFKRKEIAEKIEAFYAYLEELFGSEGAQVIQGTSLKRLYLKLWREYEEIETYFSVLDELYEVKFKLSAPSSKDGSVCN